MLPFYYDKILGIMYHSINIVFAWTRYPRELTSLFRQIMPMLENPKIVKVYWKHVHCLFVGWKKAVRFEKKTIVGRWPSCRWGCSYKHQQYLFLSQNEKKNMYTAVNYTFPIIRWGFLVYSLCGLVKVISVIRHT